MTSSVAHHGLEPRQSHDYYATHPDATKALLKFETFYNVWEPACGEGHISKVLKEAGITVFSTDLIDRQYQDSLQDFLSIGTPTWEGDIITNPPFTHAQEFIERALSIIPTGRKVAMFLRIQFLESNARKHLFKEHPPKYVYVSSARLVCAKNGDFTKYAKTSVACYCWFIWYKGYKGDTTLKWF